MAKMFKLFVYKSTTTTTGNGNASWRAHMNEPSNIIEYYGWFIKDKTYIVEKGDTPGKLKVSGFFNIVFVTQKPMNRMVRTLVDVKTPGRCPGFFALYFDEKTCKQHLKYHKTLTQKFK